MGRLGERQRGMAQKEMKRNAIPYQGKKEDTIFYISSSNKFHLQQIWQELPLQEPLQPQQTV
uniref:Uncharacterized protein n=1 Tax=Arion vulgaris TaxID=1028688 RepID=A0A0B7AN35_9EUPU